MAAHPDDEVLGCGGTIAHLTTAGVDVHVAIVAEGVTSRDWKRDVEGRREELAALNESARKAGELLGVQSVDLIELPDNRLDCEPRLELTKRIERLVETIRPATVLTHYIGDLNVDHRRVCEAVMTACRPIPQQTVRTVLSFEVSSSTEWSAAGGSAFSPDWFQDITETIDRKLAALEVYASEMRPWPHSRSIRAVEHLARWRGATVGVEAAEAFLLMRHISR